jgi:asparagine synthase (glutamine-hydrolysing)
MSGIVSLFNSNGEPIDRSLLQQLTDCIAFRGPDAQTIWINGKIGLGHTLLRTTFESQREQQPLTLDDRVWIVADARLDDRTELLQVLRDRGTAVAEDAPDVELILHAYQIWDTACVDYLMGDFAFIIWDERQQRLFCGRDQFGIVPFYYALVNNTLICSNTLNCIRQHPQVSAKLNEQAVGDFLLFGMNMEFPTTIFTDIQRLPPAHTLIWSDGNLQIQRYWTLPRTLPLIFYKRRQEYVEHFSHLFEQAVADRLHSDRIATHISGGMDSTSIAAIAQKVLSQKGKPVDFQAFTMRERQMMPEEDSYASMVAQYIDLPLNVINVEGSFFVVPPEKPETPLPEPTGIPARNSAIDVAKRCAAQARIVLTGFGGDPGLRFGEFYWLDWWKHGLQREWLAVQLNYLLTYRRPQFYLRRGLAYWRKINKEQPSFPTWFNPAFVQRLDLQARQQEMTAESIDKIARYGMANSPFWSNLFEQFDPGYNGVAVKHYYPFFDLRLVQYLASIPPVPWLVNKAILRESMQNSLPSAILNRPKKVFPFPEKYSQTMREMVEVWIGDLLTATPNLSEYVDSERVLGLLKSSEPINPTNLFQIERTLAFAYWLRSYGELTPRSPVPSK